MAMGVCNMRPAREGCRGWGVQKVLLVVVWYKPWGQWDSIAQ